MVLSTRSLDVLFLLCALEKCASIDLRFNLIPLVNLSEFEMPILPKCDKSHFQKYLKNGVIDAHMVLEQTI